MKTISKVLKAICIFYLLFILAGFSSKLQTKALEYDLKASYIFNITKFIYWNSTIPDDEFIIGIIGSSPIYEPLLEIAKAKKVNEKKIIIRQYAEVETISYCNILFIPANTSIPLSKILDQAKSKKILTISEHPGYGVLGTAINFVTIDNKLKFEVNIKTLESLELKASAQFLKLAVIIE